VTFGGRLASPISVSASIGLLRRSDMGGRGKSDESVDALPPTYWANLGSGAHIACNRSTVVHELALRPGFSPQARVPPTAQSAPQGERRGPLVLTAGPVPYFQAFTPPARWTRPGLIGRAGVLALFRPRTRERDEKA
jgi:hypothetical protein